ncbi:MAG: hypothetical protein Q8K99_11435 [Actinomycetota bacterium]|nr:hypothetical protein [Actinomycetota bacterium]
MGGSSSTVRARREERGGGSVLGVAMVVLGLLSLAALQYVMPISSRYPGSINPPGARQWAQWLGGGFPMPMSVETFLWSFRAIVVVVWIGYALVVYSGLRRGITRPMRILAVAAALAVVLAFLFPPSLSHDLYAYLGYARMGALYDLNPYVHSLQEIARQGDVAAVHYPTPLPSVYGPVWTLLSSGIAWLLSSAALPAQLVALKLVEVAALIGGAVSARAIARVWDPRHADLALVAFALNPLLLLEGPGNGHNDVLMVALMLAGIALVLRSSWKLGFLVLGVSVGVKFVSLAIVPWLVLEMVRRMSWRRAAGRTAVSGVLVLAPVLLALLPFWTGPGTLWGLGAMYNTRSSGDTTMRAGVVFVVFLYAVLTVWVWRGRGERLAPAWTLWSTAGILFAIPGILPWYLSWPTSVTLTRWDRRQAVISVACMVLGVRWMLYYTALRGG